MGPQGLWLLVCTPDARSPKGVVWKEQGGLRMFRAAVVIVLIAIACSAVFAQTQPPSDPQALSYAAQSIAAMVGIVSISDVTLSGTVTWNSSDTGTAIFRALGTSESRMDL